MQRHLIVVIVVLAAAWWLGLAPDALTVNVPAEWWRLRRTLIMGSGYLAMGCMSVAMILAARPVWLEGTLGGLDQSYRLHKRLGIAGTLFAVLHWLLAMVPKWLVGAGLLARPQRPPSTGDEAPFAALEGAAEGLGEWAFYLAVALVAIALWKRIPYRQFARIHRIFPVAYLVLVFHTVVLMPLDYWTSLSGPLMALLLAGGVVAAVLSLAGRIGFTRRALGSVESVQLHNDRVLEVHCQLDTPWAGHESGQFVFVTFDRHEGAHPFTVASAWSGDGHLVLAIKRLGDYTGTLPQRLKLGTPVVVEGPYGRFTFDSRRERQVWVAGGIGITPFISRMELITRGGAAPKPVDLFYSTPDDDEELFAFLRDLADRAGVTLHLLVSPRDGVLTADRLAQAVPRIAEAEVWFCGPKGFGDALRTGLGKRGLPRECFHQEAFEMR